MTEMAPASAWFFLLLTFVGGISATAFSFRLLRYLALCLRRSRDLRRRYGSWAVVTGPTSGIGRSMAMELARRGLNLVLLDLDAANLQETSDMIRSRHGVKTRTVVFDLSLVCTPQGDESMRRLRAAIDGLDVGVLVNNAGVGKPAVAYLHEADVEAWMRMVKVNLWALTEVTAAVLPGMVERGRGAIVNMGSASSEAIPSFPLNTIYAATKRYVATLSRSLYVEYRSKGINVQCQAPFFVATRLVPRAVRRARQLAPGVRAHGGRLCPRGGAVDRPRPALHPRRRAPAPVVPRRRRARRRARLAPPPREPAAEGAATESEGDEGGGS
ncbi:unnamed protein product [Urochloa humidicola]